MGSSRNKYKIGGCYYVLGNLSRKYRSQLDNIQLVFLCNHNLVIKYGFSKIIKPLMDDLKLLEIIGITFTFNGTEHNFLGTISFITCDNLAAHIIGGFVDSFAKTKRPCRTCKIERHNFSEFNANNVQIRF